MGELVEVVAVAPELGEHLAQDLGVNGEATLGAGSGIPQQGGAGVGGCR